MVTEEESEAPVAAKPEKTAQAAKPDDDDEDEELSSYCEKVQKRIKKLTWQAREAERQQKEAESLREEAINVAKNLHQRTQQYEKVITDGEARLVNEFKARAALAVQQAQSSYKEAYESGDTDAVIAAQTALIQAQAEQTQATNYENDYTQRTQQNQQRQQTVQQQPPPPPRPQAPKPTQEAAQWAEDNPWFGDPKHKDMHQV